MARPEKPKRGRPATLPAETRIWSKRLTAEEIAAVEQLIEKMRRRKLR